MMEAKDIIALIISAIILIIVVTYMLINQKAKVIEWLKDAVVEAEKLLGEKTGQLKLRKVYNWFIKAFPVVSAVVPFGVFAAWVDVALDTMENWLDGNKHVKAYIEGADDEGDTEELT